MSNSSMIDNEVDKTKYQQQILFDESESIESLKEANIVEQQVIFDNQDWQIVAQENIDQIEELEEKSRPRWILRTIVSLFSILLVIEAVEFFIAGFSESPIIASIYALLLFCISLIAGTSLFKELTGLRRFKHQQKMQAQAKAILIDDKPSDAQALCQKISKQLPCDFIPEQNAQWEKICQSDYNDAELLQLYSRVVLSKVDDKALKEIAKFSTESVVLVALSPVAVIDMMIVLWRNLRMINKITGLYGLKLGYWSRIKLIKQVFVNMIYAGATELIADFGTELVGADLLGKLSGRLAQGLGAGMLTARLGLKTLQLCRPISFDALPSVHEQPKLADVRKEVLGQVKALMSSNKRK